MNLVGSGDCDYLLCLDEWPPMAFLVLIGLVIYIRILIGVARWAKARRIARLHAIRCKHCNAQWWQDDFMGRRFCLSCQKYF